jgi:hypothetical protein
MSIIPSTLRVRRLVAMAGCLRRSLGWLMASIWRQFPPGAPAKRLLRQRARGITIPTCQTLRTTNPANRVDLLTAGSRPSRMEYDVMIKKLSLLILAATLLAGCAPFESYPTQQTSVTTTTTCPSGTQLQSDGMCR